MREFTSLVPGKVGIYLCGATVQGSPHIGHMRSAVAFDVLVRWLRRSGYETTMVRNVTDIDDKILAKSADAGREFWAHAYIYENEFTQAYDALGVLRPTYEPRATGHVPEMIAFIARLIERGHAYPGDSGNVYFDVASLADYGSLTRQTLDDFNDDAAVEPDKRNPRDFALWKAAKPGEPASASWDTPWGVAGQAGIWNARRWPGNIWAKALISTGAGSICASLTMKTSRHNRMGRATGLRNIGCIMRG